MSEQKHEFDFAMTCDGCLNAAKRVLSKIGVDKVKGDVENKKLYVTTDKSTDDLLTQIQKTGKAVSYVGQVS